MNKREFASLSRRDFLRRAAYAAIGTTALTSAIGDLRLMNAAVAQSNVTPGSYKALVCIFLGGGNDSNNLIVPTITPEYNNYASIRTPVLALPQSSLVPITPANNDGHNFGFHPACKELAALFNAGQLALLFNVGTLVYPITRAQYLLGQTTPPQLFSHADQVTQWQTSIPDQASTTGWGGRCADLLAAVQPASPISSLVTLTGANTFEIGNTVSQYAVSTSGAVALNNLSPARLQSLTNLLGLPSPNLQMQAYGGAALHSIDTTALLNNSILPTASASYWTNPFPATITVPNGGGSFGSALAPQLQMVARLIEAGHRSVAAGGFGLQRQIFFVSVEGYDLHTGQTPGPGSTTIGTHANLLADLSQSMNAFQNAMNQLQLAPNVTTFTASDFGRTFPSNGSGSDHGWGSHHLILGGAVKGQNTYGTFPTLAVNGPDDTGVGRWIPTTATDQYFATLATWFGIDSDNLTTVFPNLGRFSPSNLGFI
jgi:uncharacterized protein (DUF1501 family)